MNLSDSSDSFHSTITSDLPLSARVQEGLKSAEAMRFQKKNTWSHGLTILDESTVKLPLVTRKALAIKKMLSHMPVEVKKHELLVGAAVPATILRKAELPEYATPKEKKNAAKRLTSPQSVYGHISPYYPKYLTLGLDGLRNAAAEKREKIKRNGTESQKAVWYESVLISLEGLSILIQRYREAVLNLAETETVPQRKKELIQISDTLQHIMAEPPQIFHQALQSVWFAHIAFTSTLNYSPLGRFDQYMWPFLKRDLESGNITLFEAQELIDLFWVKCNDLLQSFEIQEPPTSSDDAVSIANTIARAGKFSAFLGGKTTLDRMFSDGGTSQQFLQTITVSGLTPEGYDGTNSLTYLCLNATLRLGVPQPCIYVRFHDASPPELYSKVADCIRAGCVGPTVYNDDILVPAIKTLGIPVEHARDYTSDGCWEPHVQGRTYFKHAWLSVAEVLDRVLDPESWDNISVPLYIEEMDPFKDTVGLDPYGFRSFDEVLAAVKKTLDRYIKGLIQSRERFEDGRLFDIAPLPLLSAFVEGPLEVGRDITQGAMTYTFHMPELSGLSHVADSLAVIKKLCFEQQRIPWPELLDSIRDNWENKEYLRQMIRTRVPVYGNDDDYADEIATDIVNYYINSIKKHGAQVRSDIKYQAGIATFENYTELGYVVGATPDGRFAGDALSSNASPSIGRAANGQTAAVNSYLKLPLADLPGGSILDLSVEANSNLLSYLEPFIKSFLEKGGNILNIAVNDCAKLRAAQKEPEKYRDLKVRVGGYDAYFVDLPPHHQELQIRRCEQYAE